MRTFSKAAFDEAQALWKTGGFSDEWKPYRHRAAMRGMLYPPDGTAWDSWSDDEPSQRAVIVRAIRETPKLLTAAIDHSRSWGEVYAYVTSRLNEHRDELNQTDRDTARRKASTGTPGEAVMSLKAILTRIGDS